MGIYLPNIEIPGNGIITRLLIEIPKAGKPTCEAFYDTEDGEASVKLDIGVIEVPTPHGRLIDADAFDNRVREAGGMVEEELTADFKDGVQATLWILKQVPKVIEAEK